MKKKYFLFCVLFPIFLFGQEDSTSVLKQKNKQKIGSFFSQEKTKTGLFFAPFPIFSIDQDKGVQFGASLNIYDFGNGECYPTPRQQWSIEASAYHKGSQQYILMYDAKNIIPKIRMSIVAALNYDETMNFYGFNGYCTYYDYKNINYWAKQKNKSNRLPEYTKTFYCMERLALTIKADFVGNITNHLFWQAGYAFNYYQLATINRAKINKGKKEIDIFYGKTLYDYYKDWGIISVDESAGGISSSLRFGLMYDSRDVENAPNKGIWAEGHIKLAPRFLGTTHHYYNYSLTFRHYIPIVADYLTFAYRLNYRGTFGNYMPYYMLQVLNSIGKENDRDGIGGFRTVRGILRNRVQGLDVGFFNAELRWKMVKFYLWKQNFCLALNAFLDGGMTTKYYNLSYKGLNNRELKNMYEKYINPNHKDALHLAAGGGLRLIVNQNFIVAIDYAYPFKKQDGNGCFYLNTGYLF